jgi:ankyrin repeat protein
VELLLKYGAQPNLGYGDGWTPLSRAVKQGSAAIVQLLLAHGVKMGHPYKIVRSSNRMSMNQWLILSFLAVIERKSPFEPNVELAVKARVRLCYLEL